MWNTGKINATRKLSGELDSAEGQAVGLGKMESYSNREEYGHVEYGWNFRNELWDCRIERSTLRWYGHIQKTAKKNLRKCLVKAQNNERGNLLSVKKRMEFYKREQRVDRCGVAWMKELCLDRTFWGISPMAIPCKELLKERQGVNERNQNIWS